MAFLFVPPAPSSTTIKSASTSAAPTSVPPSISKSDILILPSGKFTVPVTVPPVKGSASADWNVPKDTISTVSLADAPEANTTSDPLVAVKSALAKCTPLRYTDTKPGV